jgi:hypothetical protein
MFLGFTTGQWLVQVLLTLAIFVGCWWCYNQGKSKALKEWTDKIYRKGFDDGYTKALSDKMADRRIEEILDIFKGNVAQKIEEKIRAEYRDGTRQP